MQSKGFIYQNSFSFWVSKLAAVMQEEFNNALKRYEITWSQWLVLNHLRQNLNSTPAATALGIGVDRSAITRLVDRLEAKQLVMRMREGVDRRSVTLYLTKKGLDISSDIDAIAMEHQRSFLSSLHTSEQKMLKTSLQKLLREGGVDGHENWRIG